MPVAYSDFTTAFPEFGAVASYPQATVEFWLGQAYQNLDAPRFGNALDLAAMLYAAHYVVLAAQSAKAAKAGSGGAVGAPLTIATSKTVGPVSKTVDPSLTGYQNAGAWNATSYGQRFYQMLRGAMTGPFYSAPVRRALNPIAW